MKLVEKIEKVELCADGDYDNILTIVDTDEYGRLLIMAGYFESSVFRTTILTLKDDDSFSQALCGEWCIKDIYCGRDSERGKLALTDMDRSVLTEIYKLL